MPAKIYSFGAGGTASTGTTSGPYSVFTQVYSPVGSPTLRNGEFALKSITINGTASGFASTYYNLTDGRVGFNVNANATLRFTRYIGNGGSVIRTPQSFTWTGGGLQGNITYVTAPVAPGSISVTTSGTTATVAVTAGSDDGGSDLNLYEVQITEIVNNAVVSWGGTKSGDATVLSYSFTGLTPNKTYRFRARSRNTDNFYSVYRESGNVSITGYTYTINYAANGGSGTMTATSTTSTDTSATLTVASNSFTRTGYTFSGWNTETNGSGTSYSSGSNVSLTSDSPTLNLNAQWTLNSFTIFYDGNGATSGSTTNTTWTYSSTSGTVRTNGFTRTGFSFIGWNTQPNGTGTSYSPGDSYSYNTADGSSSVTLYALWAASFPVFTDTIITNTGILGRNISLNADRTVSATPVASYSIVYSGSGANPTTWLTINSSGELSGTPPAVGLYTFLVRASNGGSNITDSPVLSLNIRPAGKRFNGSNFADASIARRFDGSNWIDLTIMKKWNGTSWENITN